MKIFKALLGQDNSHQIWISAFNSSKLLSYTIQDSYTCNRMPQAAADASFKQIMQTVSTSKQYIKQVWIFSKIDLPWYF